MSYSLLKSIIDIPTPLLIILIAVSTISLVFIFSHGYEDGTIAPLFYTLSAYALASSCFKIPKLKPLVKRIKENEIFKNTARRQKYSLTLSVVFNGLYIVTKSIAGLVFHTPWLIALAAYYLIVFLMKLILVFTKEATRKTPLLLGSALIISTLPLSFISKALVKKSFAFTYPGYLIYVFALYSFIFLSTALYGFITNGRNKSIKEKCYRTLSLSLAAVTILTLQSAMFSSFSPNENPLFEKRMHAILSLAIVIIVALLGLHLIREWKNYKPRNMDQ